MAAHQNRLKAMPSATIHCSTIEHLNWQTAELCNFVIHDGVDVWRIAISEKLDRLDEMRALLLPDEHARAEHYSQEKDRNRFIISRGYLRILLGKYLNLAPQSIRFDIGNNKKPNVKNTGNINLRYNVSHSGNYILIAVADTEVGVDVEHMAPHHYDEIMEIALNQAEMNYVKSSTNPIASFYTLWTRKEALLKATAKGIDDNLKNIPSLNGEHIIDVNIIGSLNSFFVKSFKIDENYTACISSIVKKITFWYI